MRNWITNPGRLRELVDREEADKAVEALAAYRSKEAMRTLAVLWSAVLVMAFTGIVTVRAAFLLF